MITFIRSKALAELRATAGQVPAFRQQLAESHQAEAAAVAAADRLAAELAELAPGSHATLRARTVALEAASYLTGDYPEPFTIPARGRQISEWIGSTSAEDFEIRMAAVAQLLADLDRHRNHVYGAAEFTAAAEHYYRMLSEPAPDTRPAAGLSTAQLRDGANHQTAGAIR